MSTLDYINDDPQPFVAEKGRVRIQGLSELAEALKELELLRSQRDGMQARMSELVERNRVLEAERMAELVKRNVDVGALPIPAPVSFPVSGPEPVAVVQPEQTVEERAKVPTWYEYFIGIARAVSERSKDPRTKVGCVIVGPDHDIRATGYNGFVAGVYETAEKWERPEKHKYVVHAELNALLAAARQGQSVKGCWIYCTLPVCPSCALAIAQAGITQVLIDSRARTYQSDWYTEDARTRVRELFERKKIRYSFC